MGSIANIKPNRQPHPPNADGKLILYCVNARLNSTSIIINVHAEINVFNGLLLLLFILLAVFSVKEENKREVLLVVVEVVVVISVLLGKPKLLLSLFLFL